MCVANYKKYRIFGNSTFDGSRWLVNEPWFYVAYDGACLDPRGMTICNFNSATLGPVKVTPEIINNFLIEVTV